MTACRDTIKQWRKRPEKVNPARQIVRTAIRSGTMDDCSTIIVNFHREP
jgi:hypothetical protein